MNIAFYSAVSGLIAQQQGLNVYSNNIANVNTNGYKPLRPSFADCIYTEQRKTEDDWQSEHGQFSMKTDFMWEEGTLVETDQQLDFALPNSGFFMVQDRNGDNYLTRDGSFNMSLFEGTWHLVNGSGDFVLDGNGNKIQIPFKTTEAGAPTNEVLFDEVTGLIGVYTVPNNWGLDQSGNNHFKITESSGQPTVDPIANKLRMSLEMSSTDLASDMVRIIETQRSYQLNAKIVQTADEFQRIANTLRG